VGETGDIDYDGPQKAEFEKWRVQDVRDDKLTNITQDETAVRDSYKALVSLGEVDAKILKSVSDSQKDSESISSIIKAATDCVR